MSTTNATTNDRHGNRSDGHCCGGWGKRANWTGVNIAGMVIGFVLFWPIGLFILYWIITGRDVKELPQGIRNQWSKITGKRGDGFGNGFTSAEHSDNTVFNEYQQTQFDRIRELKEEIKERSRRFSEYRANARRRADEEEFNQFMSDMPRADG